MARWLVEKGIGETRAALVEDGHIVAARLWRESLAPHAGQVMDAVYANAAQNIAKLPDERPIQLTKKVQAISEGAPLQVQITRGAIIERSGGHSRMKPARGAVLDAGVKALNTAQDPDDVTALLADNDHPVDHIHLAPPPASDALALAGWDDLMAVAMAGITAFAGGELLITPTPAMTVIDIDGILPPAQLAIKAAGEAALALHRLDIGGVIAIDFPTLERRSDRQRAAEAFDAAMIGPFERIAVNGFGLMQVVRRRRRPSLVELAQLCADETALLALLRRAERWNHAGNIALRINMQAAALVERYPHWTEQLSQRTGRKVNVEISANTRDDFALAPLETADGRD